MLMVAEEIIIQEIEIGFGLLEFTHDLANSYPTVASIQKVYDERDFQRACQACCLPFHFRYGKGRRKSNSKFLVC